MGALDGKVALVAGGGTGIGRAIAERFAREGARVAVFGRRPEPLREVAGAIGSAGGTALAIAGDVGHESDVAGLVAAARSEWGGVDVMVNSAAVRLQSRLTEISAADFAEVLRINLVGAFVLTKLVTGPMRERGGGSIIHIGSALGQRGRAVLLAVRRLQGRAQRARPRRRRRAGRRRHPRQRGRARHDRYRRSTRV